MHACGHDGHVAIGLGLGLVLPRIGEELGGKVRLLFQPAEEGCRGAKSMADAGAISNVDYLIGLHLGVKATSTGTVLPGINGLLATHKFDVTFTGKSAHAGIDPEEGRNALLAAAAAALNMHAASAHGQGSSRVNVGYLTAGDGRNVIPSKAHMMVETRGSESNIEEHVYQHALHCIQGAATSYQVAYDIIPMGWAPSAKCDGELVQVIREAADIVPEIHECMDLRDGYGGSDDFTIMMNLAQKAGARACFVCLGSNLKAGHHREKFDFDEDSLVIGVKLLSQAVNLLLNRAAKARS
jgi:aminobenzoyl-glutamate utilization protein A